MKKYLPYTLGVLLIGLIVIIILVFNNKPESVIEDDSYVKVKDNIQLDVNKEYYLKDFITIKEGKLFDSVIDTEAIGSKTMNVFYEAKNKKRKFTFTYEVVDQIKPLILGGSSLTYKINSNPELIHSFFSADNYDSNPKREIIGEYDFSKNGTYNLKLKVTDSSNNESIKDFKLNIVSSVTVSKPIPRAKIDYQSIYEEHKNSNTLIGLDISKWQGEVDFDLLKANKVEFIMLRVGYQKGFSGEYIVDPYFERNVREANRVGIPVGGYFYTYAKTTKEAKEQALWLIDQVKNYEITHPLVYDFEAWSGFSKLQLSLNNLNNLAKTFMDTVNEHGYQGMNYSSKYYLNNIWNLNNYPVWLAHYTKKTDYQGPYNIWQLGDTGRIPGINGDVDINVMYLK